MTPITFAHRGARSEQPENTLAAFRRALALGARGLESDAWLSADGQVVLVHDPVVRRGARRLRIGRSPAEELARFGVPRLTDLYAELGTGFELSIDVKQPEVAEPLLAITSAAGPDALARLWLCSPDDATLTRLRADGHESVRLVHSTSRRRIRHSLERHAADLAAAGIDVMNLHHSEWSAGLVALFHRFGVQAFAWDLQELRHLRAVLTIGVDAVYSDHVDRMVAAVDEWRADDG